MRYSEINKTAERVALPLEKTETKVNRYLRIAKKNGTSTNKGLALEYLWKNRKRGLTQADAVRQNNLRLSSTIKSLRDDDMFAIITIEEEKAMKPGVYGRYFLIVEGESADDYSK